MHRDSNPSKSSGSLREKLMKKQVDRDSLYMKENWGTTRLITDYGSMPDERKQQLREIVNDDMNNKKHNLKMQAEFHEKIRNDDDYDDWAYGTEPTYGKKMVLND